MFSAIGIKFPLATYESIKDTLPDATVYRTISHQKSRGFIELYYILDSEIFSPAQLKWFADIKTRIKQKLPFVEIVEFDKDFSVRALSSKIYTLKSLSDVWRKVRLSKKKSDVSVKGTLEDEWSEEGIIIEDDDFIKVPQLIPLTMGAKEHENLYRTLCIYGKRLHYEKLFIFEYMSLASNIYAQDMSLLSKEVLKITRKAFEFIAEQIELHPEDFKQKLTKEELKEARLRNVEKLQKYNDSKRAENIIIVTDAIASGIHYKSDGVTLNKSSLANATKFNRATINAILNSILP